MAGDINQITDDDVKAFQLTVEQSYHDEGNALDLYQKIATKTAIYPGTKGPFGLAYVGLKLNGEAGEFVEHVGKAFRDDGFGGIRQVVKIESKFVELTPERKEACNELGIKLSYAALKNLVKLNDRTKRNVLSGSGDNR